MRKNQVEKDYDKIIRIAGEPTNQEGFVEPVFRDHQLLEQQLLEVKRKQ